MKKKYSLIIIGGLLLTLSSCNVQNPFSFSSSNSSTSKTSNTTSSQITSASTSSDGNFVYTDKAYYSKNYEDKYKSYTARELKFKTSSEGYSLGRDVFQKQMDQDEDFARSFGGEGKTYMPSLGASKLLVIPVAFSGTSLISKRNESDIRNQIYKAFFGSEEDVYWESVSSYYYKASYGQLDIQGEVAPIMNFNYYYLNKRSSPFGAEAARTSFNEDTFIAYLTRYAYDLYFSGSSPLYNYEDFDSNGDGIIDGIYFVSLEDLSATSDKELDWAFTYWSTLDSNYTHLGSFSWSSINFSTYNKGSEDKPDSHTFIHETGHILGLNDYYDPSYTENSSNYSGGPTMQDNNICDHDPLSKYLLGWIDLDVIDSSTVLDQGEQEFELPSFEESGKVLLLANSYNNTSLDEYLLVIYYTPTYLNEADSKEKYEAILGIDQEGIQIWHVDKSVYDTKHYETTSSRWPYQRSEVTEWSVNPDNNMYINEEGKLSCQSNTEGYNYLMFTSTNNYAQIESDIFTHPELEMIRKDTISSSSEASSSSLFKEGDTFNGDSDIYKDFSFYTTSKDIDEKIYNTNELVEKAYIQASKENLSFSLTVNSLSNSAKVTIKAK